MPRMLALRLNLAGEKLRRGGLNAISLIRDRHSDLRDASRFEPPPSKRLRGNFVENRVTSALRHHPVGNLSASSVHKHRTDTTSSNIGALFLVRILRQRCAYRRGLGSRQ